jgi:hypothetical protein
MVSRANLLVNDKTVLVLDVVVGSERAVNPDVGMIKVFCGAP